MLFLRSAFSHLPRPQSSENQNKIIPRGPSPMVRATTVTSCGQNVNSMSTLRMEGRPSLRVVSERDPIRVTPVLVHLQTHGRIGLQRWPFRHWALDGTVAGRSLNSCVLYRPMENPRCCSSSFPLLVLQNRRAGWASGLGSLFQPSSPSHSFPGHRPWLRKDQLIHSFIGPNIY